MSSTVTSRTAPYARTVRKESGGPGLLLAHGGGGSVESNFGAILDELAATHTVAGVDYPGTGGTPKAEAPLELDELADQLVAAADAEGLERFAVLGYSLGGNVALRLAARYPERVTALVLTATFVRAGNRLKLVGDLWSGLAGRGESELLARLLVPLAFSPAALEGLTPEQVEQVVRETAGSIPPGSGDHVDLIRGRICARRLRGSTYRPSSSRRPRTGSSRSRSSVSWPTNCRARGSRNCPPGTSPSPSARPNGRRW